MKFRISIALAMALLLLVAVGCNQEQINAPQINPDLTFDDQYDFGAVSGTPSEDAMAGLKQSPLQDVIPGAYIIQFKAGVDNVPQRARDLAGLHGFNLRNVYQHAITGFSARIPGSLADRLRGEFDVLRVEQDRVVRIAAQAFPSGVDRIDTELNPTANIDESPTGVDVDIAIIDTGIDFNHVDLNVVGGVRILGGVQNPNFMDGNGHGTHVAGTAAALDNNLGVVGVAPGARLWGVKVLSDAGFGSTSDIIAGLDWVAARAADIDVVNMSIQGTGWSNPYHDAVANVVAQGVVVVVAAGNSSKDIYGNDGTIGTADDVLPAAFPEAATITALADDDGLPLGLGGNTSYGPDDSFASFSNFSGSVFGGNPVNSPGAAIDLMLPGVDILSTFPGDQYALNSGTSMASPHATGLFGLYIAANGKPANAAGVYAARQALIDGGVPQASPLGMAVANDPDANAEPLGWAAVPAAYGDVSVMAFSGDASVSPGGVLTMTGTLANRGNLDVTTPFAVRVFEQNSGFNLVNKTLPGLGVGNGVTRTVNFTVPAKELAAALPPGIYTLILTHNFTDPVSYRNARAIQVELLPGADTGTIVVNPDPDALNAPWTLNGPNKAVFNGNGDLTLPNVPVGDYTITWGAVAGWTAPADQTLTLNTGATITFAGTYTEIVTVGDVVINPDPDALNAPWSVTGPDKAVYTGNGDDQLTGVPVGDYVMTWGAVAGWMPPADETLTLTDGATITFAGTYTEIVTTGTVVINPDPDALNASWSVTGPDKTVYTGNGDSTLPGVPAGDYTMTWGDVGGWTKPADETLTLAADATITFNGLYVEILPFGDIVVDAEPNVLNAPWTINGPGGLVVNGNGDATQAGAPAGDYTITWGAVAGWIAPAGETLTLVPGGTITFTGVYTEIPLFGDVVINSEPDSLNASWSVTGPDKAVYTGNGDDTLSNVPVGDYTMVWGDVAGWTKPADETLTLNAGAAITFAGLYVEIPQVGTVVVNPDPDALNAPWTVTGPDKAVYNGTGDDTLTDVPIGDYTVAWGAVAGWTAPAGETLALALGQTITFNGVYTEMLGTITIDAEPDILNAGWQLSGPGVFLSGNGDDVVVDLAAGTYTVTWLDVVGWVTPAAEMQILVAGGNLTYTGVYTEIVGGAETIGLYFDLSGTLDPLTSCEPANFLEHYNVKLIYENPAITATGGFECGWDFVGVDASFGSSLTIQFPTPGVDVGSSNPPEGIYNIIVGFGAPLPLTEGAPNVLADIDWFFLDGTVPFAPGEELRVFLRPADPATVEGELGVLSADYLTFYPIATPYAEGSPAMHFNPTVCEVVFAKKSAWDNVRSVFR